jgi:hypothetical protein
MEHKSNLLVNECENFGVGCNFQQTLQTTSGAAVFRVKKVFREFLEKFKLRVNLFFIK